MFALLSFYGVLSGQICKKFCNVDRLIIVAEMVIGFVVAVDLVLGSRVDLLDHKRLSQRLQLR